MDAKRILKYLRQLSANNNRPWFQDHKPEYEAIRADFERGVQQALERIVTFDTSIAHLTVKDCTYRAHGKKSLHGGYYLHLEPGHCMVACGNYWLPTNILTSCRNEIMGNTEEWLRCVQSPEFLKYFGSPVSSSFPSPTDVSSWDQPQGFGLERLKTCPSGFPRDWEYLDYLRQKDYCCWHQVPDDFYQGDAWLDEAERMFLAAKPMMDMMNAVIDDYE